MKYLNIKNLVTLQNAIADANEVDDAEFIYSMYCDVQEYVNSIYTMQARIARMHMEGIDGEELRNAVQTMDRTRRLTHNGAIASVHMCIKLASLYGVESFCSVPEDSLNDLDDLEMRDSMTEFCIELMVAVFYHGYHPDETAPLELSSKPLTAMEYQSAVADCLH